MSGHNARSNIKETDGIVLENLSPLSAELFRLGPERTNLPENVKLAQWVISQFLTLKKYGIAQDLARVPEFTIGPAEPGGDMEDEIMPIVQEFRPVYITFTQAEESTYNTALGKLQEWINKEDTPNDKTQISQATEVSEDTEQAE